MANYLSFSGMITDIDEFLLTGEFERDGCVKRMTFVNQDAMTVNFIVVPTTYVVNQTILKIGDEVTGFFDASLPVPLVYPPQYRAFVLSKRTPSYQVAVDYFDENLVSGDKRLRLTVSPATQVVLQNNQLFYGELADRLLIVLYGAATRSIPAITTPSKIIVMC